MSFLIDQDRSNTFRRNAGKAAYYKQREFERILVPIQDRRGPGNEAIVGRILEDFRVRGIIRSFYRTKPFSRQDMMGIDFLVIKNDSSRIVIQVKSSRHNAEKFTKKGEKLKNNNRYDGVYCVLVKTDYLVNDQPLRDELENIVSIAE